MGLGYAADRNEVANPAGQNPCTVTSNVPWAATAPLEALRTLPLADAAVSTVLGSEAAPVTILLAVDAPIDLTLVALWDTNLAQAATVRVEAWTDAAMQDLAASRQVNVVPPLIDPATLRFGAANQFRGDLDPRDYPGAVKHVYLPVPLCRVRRVRLTLWGGTVRLDGTPDTGYRIGWLWAGDGVTIDRHVGASGEGYRSGDQRIETDGGGVWVEPGIGRRTVLIDQTVTDRTLRDELFRMAMRTGKSQPMAWLPDIDDPALNWLYGGLYRRIDDHSHKCINDLVSAGSLELEEVRE